MSSNIEIKKKCKWCGQIFIARKTTTNYCSHRCNNAAYKERIRQERIATYQKEFSIKTEKPSIEDKEFYTPPEAAKLLRISRASIYRYMADNIIKVVQFKGKTLVRRKDIELLFENAADSLCLVQHIVVELPFHFVLRMGIDVDAEVFPAAHLHRFGVTDCRIIIQIQGDAIIPNRSLTNCYFCTCV